jgi:hypothetical protein
MERKFHAQHRKLLASKREPPDSQGKSLPAAEEMSVLHRYIASSDRDFKSPQRISRD